MDNSVYDDDSLRENNDRKRPGDESLESDEKEEKIPRVESESSVEPNSSSESHSKSDEKFDEGASLEDKLVYVEKNRGDIPAIHYAAVFADVDVCQKLVDDGEDVNETDENGNDVYHFAAINELNCEMKLLDFFVNCKAKIKRLNKDHMDAVMVAVILEKFEFARKLHNLYGSNESLLSHCCTSLKPESIKYAYEQDPSIVKEEGKDEFDLRILERMAQFHNLDTFKWIIEEAKNFGVDVSKNKELQLRILRGAALNLDEPNGKEIASFLSCSYADNWTEQDLTPILIKVLPSGNLEVIKLMVKHGADLNVGMMEGHLSLFQYCVGMNAIESALFVHQRNPEEISLSTLVTAATTENIQMCEWVVGLIKESDLDSLIPDYLHFAAKYTPFGAAIIRHFDSLMLPHINSVNSEGTTALHSAVDAHNLSSFQALVEIGADLTVKYHDVNLLHYCLFKNFLKGAKIVFAKDPSQLQGRQAFVWAPCSELIRLWLATVGVHDY